MEIQLNNLSGAFYGLVNEPTTENITLDLSNSQIGGLSCVYHNHSVEPIISGANVLKSGKYKTNTLNLIWLTKLDGNNVLASYQTATLYVPPIELTPITFVNGPNNLLTNPQSGQYSTSTGTTYSAYGNSDFKIPANQLSYIEVDVPNVNLNNVMLGLATSNVAGNWTQTKFNFTIFRSTSAPKFITHQNGVLVNSNAGSYYYGGNSKVRFQRDADGTCKIFKSLNGINFELAYTYSEQYAGEMYFVISINNNQAILINPKGFNIVPK